MKGEGAGWGRKEEEGKRGRELNGDGKEAGAIGEGEVVKGTEFTFYVLSKQIK